MRLPKIWDEGKEIFHEIEVPDLLYAILGAKSKFKWLIGFNQTIGGIT
jgi:hypothetical protein